jgi:hypothetical protein
MSPRYFECKGFRFYIPLNEVRQEKTPASVKIVIQTYGLAWKKPFPAGLRCSRNTLRFIVDFESKLKLIPSFPNGLILALALAGA